ncbi:hypothetical protein WDU94_002296 [Cyamophila willieti]
MSHHIVRDSIKMNSLATPPGLREMVQAVIMNISKPCLIHMSLCGLVPYNINMKLTPINLFLNVVLSVSTFLLIFIFNIVDVRFLNVKTFDLIPAIILYVYNITLCVYLLFNFVQNIRKHRKSEKIIHKLVHIDTQLISLLHLSLSPFNSLLQTWVLSLSLWNICLYSFFFIFTLTLFPYPIYRVAGFMGTIVNNNVILILLLAKQRILRVRFDILTNVIWSVGERRGATEEIRIGNKMRRRSFYNKDNEDVVKNRAERETHGETKEKRDYQRDSRNLKVYSDTGNATSGNILRERVIGGANDTSGHLLNAKDEGSRPNDVKSRRSFFLRDNKTSGMIERNNISETDGVRSGNVIDIIPYEQQMPLKSNRSGHIVRHHRENNSKTSLGDTYREIKDNAERDIKNHTVLVKPSIRIVDVKDERPMKTNDIYHKFETRISKTRRQHDEFIGSTGTHWGSRFYEYNGQGMENFPRLEEDLKSNEVMITTQNSKNYEPLLKTLENVVKIHFDICEVFGIAMHKSGFGPEETKKMVYYGSWFVSQLFWIFPHNEDIS